MRARVTADPTLGKVFDSLGELLPVRDRVRTEMRRYVGAVTYTDPAIISACRRHLVLSGDVESFQVQLSGVSKHKATGLQVLFDRGPGGLLNMLLPKTTVYTTQNAWCDYFVQKNAILRRPSKMVYIQGISKNCTSLRSLLDQLTGAGASDIDVEATYGQCFGTVNDPAALRRIGNLGQDPRVPILDAHGVHLKSSDATIVVFKTVQAAEASIKRINSTSRVSLWRLKAQQAKPWTWMAGPDKLGGVLRRRQMTVGCLSMDHVDLLHNVNFTFPYTVFEGGDTTEELFANTSEFRESMLRVNGSVIYTPHCAIVLRIDGFGDGGARKSTEVRDSSNGDVCRVRSVRAVWTQSDD